MSTNIPALKTAKSIDRDADVIVVGLTSVGGTPTLVGVPADLEKAWSKQLPSPLLEVAIALGARSELGTLATLPPVPQKLVVVGLGDVDVTPSALRHACGAALRKISGTKDAENLKVTISLELHDPELARAAAEGAVLGAYRVPCITQKPKKSSVSTITLVTGRAQLKESVEEAGVIAAAVVKARDWINTPPNLLYPETFAESAKAHVSDLKIGTEILDEKALAKGGYGGILAVGGGSSRSPRLLRLTWAPRGAKFHLALVGKGITFDTGGVSIKPAANMDQMISDMGGSAAVLATIIAAARLKLNVKVTATIPMAENMPGGNSYRPGDVITHYGGTTSEILNTDAEGRLILADAIARASEDNPDYLIETATLTGAQMVALGLRTAGVMGSDAFRDRVAETGRSVGEQAWAMPIPEEMSTSMSSPVADLRNADPSRWGGMLSAGYYLGNFVGEGIEWVHIDIAGPSFNTGGAHGYTPARATGAPVRTLIAVLEGIAGE